jgi:hypothetical protein
MSAENPIRAALRPALRSAESPARFMLDCALDDIAAAYVGQDLPDISIRALAEVLPLHRDTIKRLCPAGVVAALRGQRAATAGIAYPPAPTSEIDARPDDGQSDRREEKKEIGQNPATPYEADLAAIRDTSKDFIRKLPPFYLGTALAVWDGKPPADPKQVPVIASLLADLIEEEREALAPAMKPTLPAYRPPVDDVYPDENGARKPKGGRGLKPPAVPVPVSIADPNDGFLP